MNFDAVDMTVRGDWWGWAGFDLDMVSIRQRLSHKPAPTVPCFTDIFRMVGIRSIFHGTVGVGLCYQISINYRNLKQNPPNPTSLSRMPEIIEYRINLNAGYRQAQVISEEGGFDLDMVCI
jgi:hypothetical protein